MSKSKLIAEISSKTEANKQQINSYLEAFCLVIQSSIANDENVYISGFGSFHKSHRSARAGRNPKTGEIIKIEAKNHIKFKAGKKFKEVINTLKQN